MEASKTLFGSILLILTIILGCTEKAPNSIELITSPGRQESIFNQLMALAANTVQTNLQNDSLAFLILPVEASCPACRKKTVDSVLKHQNSLADNHYIIITAHAGRKTINSYFREQKGTIPDIPQVILDTINAAKEFHLFETNPAIYYAVNRKVYKKVITWPATVKQDLQEFFSGKRSNIDLVEED